MWFFVYQYAKLRMLGFFNEFIDKFMDRSDYCLLDRVSDCPIPFFLLVPSCSYFVSGSDGTKLF